MKLYLVERVRNDGKPYVTRQFVYEWKARQVGTTPDYVCGVAYVARQRAVDIMDSVMQADGRRYRIVECEVPE